MIVCALRFVFHTLHKSLIIHTHHNTHYYNANRVSTDLNAPNKDQVFEFMDKAILNAGVNLIDTVSDILTGLDTQYIVVYVCH